MGWYSKPDEWPEKKGYAGEIVTLCREFDNVYMDFSYLFEIIDRDDYRENLVANLKREMLASGKLADRIMYGSDWPMPAMASRTNEFLDALRGIFNGSGFGPQFADKFFFTNAVRFLNLEGFIERHEHKSFFSKESLDHLKHVCEMAK
jgi:predicted TIM-barrel fold metal-dependent hydrolase